MKKYLLLLLITISGWTEVTHSVPKIHLNLQDLLKRAVKYSLIINEKNREESKQHLIIDEIKSRFYPKINIQNRFNLNLLKNDAIDSTDYYANLSINWNLFGFYQNYKNIQLANDNLDIMQLKHTQDKLIECISIIELYFQYWSEKDSEKLIEEEIKILKKKIAINKFLSERGKISAEELQSIKNQLPLKQNALKKIIMNIEKIIKEIKKRLLIKQEVSFFPPQNFNMPPFEKINIAAEELISSSSIIKAAKKNTELAKDYFDNSKTKRWTNLNTTMYFSNAFSLDDFDWERDKENFFLGFGLSWGLPVFDAGQIKRDSQRAKINYEEAQLTEEKLLYEINEQISRLVGVIKQDYEKRLLLEKQLEKENKILYFNTTLYKKGKISENDYQLKQFENLNSRCTLNKAIYKEIISRLNLSALSGKLPYWITEEEIIL